MKLIDPAGREIKNLRISVTQRCNLDCIYCHREGEKSHGNEMSIDRIINIVESAAELGINEIKITGGEPLMRDDIVDIVEGISSVDGIGEISMTTNGTLLKNLAKPLKDAGLNRVNIGCDSLHSNGIIEKNRDVILPGLISARNVGLTPIKINMVVLRGINDHEIWNMIEFAKKYKAVLQLIELIPLRRSIYNKYKFS
ncbi:MAG: GTP 3',8-cyclase MoaA, partial [Candidatus Altiarchaeales archaeon]